MSSEVAGIVSSLLPMRNKDLTPGHGRPSRRRVPTLVSQLDPVDIHPDRLTTHYTAGEEVVSLLNAYCAPSQSAHLHI